MNAMKVGDRVRYFTGMEGVITKRSGRLGYWWIQWEGEAFHPSHGGLLPAAAENLTVIEEAGK